MRIAFPILLWLLWPINYVMCRVVIQLLQFCGSVNHKGIALLSSIVDGSETEFQDQVAIAIDFLDQKDPRRGRLVRERLSRIVDSPVIAGGQYNHSLRLCRINYFAYRIDVVGDYPLEGITQEILTQHLARVLVHEATHGRIHARGIRYHANNHDRVEVLCRRQEYYHAIAIGVDENDRTGRVIDWKKQLSFEPLRDRYRIELAKSPWMSMQERSSRLIRFFRGGADAHAAATMSFEASGGDASEVTCSCWGDESLRMREAIITFPPQSAEQLESAAGWMIAAGLIPAAIESLVAIETVATQRQWHANYLLAEAAAVVGRHEISIQAWQSLLSNSCWRSAVRNRTAVNHRLARRFEEANHILEELEDELKDEEWVLPERVQLAVAQKDFPAAWQLLEQHAPSQRSLGIDDDWFSLRTVRASVARELEDHVDAEQLLDEFNEARLRWINEEGSLVRRRRGVVVNRWDDGSGCHAVGFVVLFRIDQDVTDDQLSRAVAFAGRISDAMDEVAFEGRAAVLQGLGYGSEKFPIREIDWKQLDAPDQLEGRWAVADLEVERIWLSSANTNPPTINLYWKERRDGDQPPTNWQLLSAGDRNPRGDNRLGDRAVCPTYDRHCNLGLVAYIPQTPAVDGSVH